MQIPYSLDYKLQIRQMLPYWLLGILIGSVELTERICTLQRFHIVS